MRVRAGVTCGFSIAGSGRFSNHVRQPSVNSSLTHEMIAFVIGQTLEGAKLYPRNMNRRRSFVRPATPRAVRDRAMLANRRLYVRMKWKNGVDGGVL